MRLTVLGSGTSTGVPVIGCNCKVCLSKHSRNRRLRASVWIQWRNKSILIDTSPDLRQQAFRAKIPWIDAVLFTHPHADHIHGIDDLRSYNFIQKKAIPAFGNHWTCEELRKKFTYIFDKKQHDKNKMEGGGIPQVELQEMDALSPSIEILGETIVPLAVHHGSRECVGYRFESVAYVTDCSKIPDSTKNRMKDLSVLILDCVRIEPHSTHFNLNQALDTISELKPKKAFLTHLGHEFDYLEWRKKLPKGVAFAYDGLVVHTPEKRIDGEPQ